MPEALKIELHSDLWLPFDRPARALGKPYGGRGIYYQSVRFPVGFKPDWSRATLFADGSPRHGATSLNDLAARGAARSVYDPERAMVYVNHFNPEIKYVLTIEPDYGRTQGPHSPPLESGTCRGSPVVLRILDETSLPRAQFPANGSLALPFGELASMERIRLVDDAGEELPAQCNILGKWEDSSIRWLHVRTMVDATPTDPGQLFLEYGPSVSSARFDTSLATDDDGRRIVVDTGVLRVAFDRLSAGWLADLQVRSATGQLIEPLEAPGIFAELIDETGTIYTSDGTKPERITLIESGPVCAVVEVRGWHQNLKGNPLLAYRARFTFYSGCETFRLLYTVVNMHEGMPLSEDDIRELCNRSLPPQAVNTTAVSLQFLGIKMKLATPGEKGFVTSAGGRIIERPLREEEYAFEHQFSLRECRLTIKPDVETLKPRPSIRSDGWFALGDQTASVAVAGRHWHANWPKSFTASADGSFCAGLFPAESDPWRIVRGMAKTHELFFRFDARSPSSNELREWSDQWRTPVILTPEPEAVCASYAAGPLPAPKTSIIDRSIERAFDALIRFREGNPDGHYGITNFGDFAAASHRPHQGPTNLPGDILWGLLTQFLRAGEPKYFIAAEACARHLIDVDIFHYPGLPGSDLARGLAHEPSAGHNLGPTSAQHSYLRGLILFYQLTGDAEARQAARNMADALSAILEAGGGHKGCEEDGWPIIGLLGAYEAFWDVRYLHAAKTAIEAAAAARNRISGLWERSATQGEAHGRTLRLEGTIGVFLNALRLYHELAGDKMTSSLLAGATKAAIQAAWVADQLTFRKVLTWGGLPPSAELVEYPQSFLAPIAMAVETTRERSLLNILLKTYGRVMDQAAGMPHCLSDQFDAEQFTVMTAHLFDFMTFLERISAAGPIVFENAPPEPPPSTRAPKTKTKTRRLKLKR